MEALAAAYAQRPDLLLTDIQMPLMNGVELTRRLRADLSMGETPDREAGHGVLHRREVVPR